MAQRGVNKVILVGNVGNDPENKFLPSGKAVANFTLATSETWKDKNSGDPQEKTEWHRLVAFDRLAEIIGEYVRKGAKLYIEGKLQTRSWEQDGVKRYATEIIVNEMQMLGGKNDGGDQRQSSGEQQQRSSARPAPAPAPAPSNFDNFDDDIPF